MSSEYSKLVKESARGSLALGVGQVLSSVILAISTIIVAGNIGSVHYGEYAKVLVPVGIALLIQDPGINVALTRFVSLYQKDGDVSKQSTAIMTGLVFNLSTAVILSLILYFFATPIAASFLQQSDLDQTLRIASFAVIGQTLINITNAIFLGYMRIKQQNISLIIYSIIKGVVSSGLVILGFGLTGAIVGHVVGYLLAGTIALILVLVYLKRVVGFNYPSKAMLHELVSFGSPLYLSSLIGGALGQFTSSLMVIYVATDQVGNYGAALTFTVLISFLLSPIQQIIYPMFSKLEAGTTYLRHAYENAVKYSSLLGVTGAFALIGLATPLITTIYEDKYPTAAGYFVFYLLTYLPIGFGSSCQGSLLNSQGKTRVTMFMNILSLITGVSLSLLLIPRFGILGLIFSIIGSPYPAIIYAHVYIKRNFGLSFDRVSAIKVYICSLVGLGMTLTIQMFLHFTPLIELVVGAAAFIFVFLVMLKVTRILNSDDYQIIRSLIDSTGPIRGPLNRLLSIYEKL